MSLRAAMMGFLGLLMLPQALGHETGHPPWKAPGPGDRRGPCPMMNAIANHGFLPHSGRDITGDQMRDGFVSGTNIDPAAIADLIRVALAVSTTGNSSTFNLDDLASPVTEHDGSLSRADRYGGGDVLAFNKTIWGATLAHFTDPVVTLEQAATARADRLAAAEASNPEYSMSESEEKASFFETTAYLLFLGRGTQGTARRDYVRSLFEHERLPYRLGWTKPDEPVTLAKIFELTEKVRAATPPKASNRHGDELK